MSHIAASISGRDCSRAPAACARVSVEFSHGSETPGDIYVEIDAMLLSDSGALDKTIYHGGLRLSLTQAKAAAAGLAAVVKQAEIYATGGAGE